MPSSSPDDATSPVSAGPTWAPPRAPLPPHRLAKLANALGVSTPIPIIHAISSPSSSYAPSPIAPSTAASSAFDFRRSPTPSIGSTHTYTPVTQTSRYLLHVIPPSHLPHESGNVYDNELLPPPPSASGYHAQFRRGILVPVYPTLQSQLAAIAKEYALPSTVGLVLYLINSSPAAQASMRLGNITEDEGEAPGPRISEDIWRHIWVRVLKAGREEPPPSAVRTKGLGFGSPAAQSSPSLLQDVMSNQSSLRPLLSPMRAETPQLMTPSPSTTASHSAISSRSDLDSPESATSVSDGGNGDDIPLPGLHSPALIPILAKVEFDIDKRKAAWYDRWKRSRRGQHAKRAESRLGMQRRAASRTGDESGAEGEGDEEGNRKPAMALRLVDRLQATENTPAYLRPRNGRLLGPDADEDEYAQLPDSDREGGGSDEEADVDATARYGQGSVSGDPLADVFGTDAETWADIHAENEPQRRRASNPNVVDLALDGAALSALPDPAEDGEPREVVDDAAEVAELLRRSSRPQLSVAIPASPPEKPRRGSQGSSLSRKHVPPALNLAPSLPGAANPNGPATDGSNLRLAYLQEEGTPVSSDFSKRSDEAPSDGETTHKPMRRSPLDEKREGVFYDELDLGLESSYEYDEDDPHDRRKSQVLMMAKLDEIERNLAQFSPRKLAIEDLAAETPTGMPSIASSLTPTAWRGSASAGPSPNPSPKPGPPAEGASWPAVPYSALSSMNGSGPEDPEPTPADGMPSPPRIAFNGISTDLPKSPFQKRTREDVISDETLARKRELEEEQDALYPPLVAPSLLRHTASDSPIIPLSPDPFGRFPSELDGVPPMQAEIPPSASRKRHAHNNKSSSGMSDAPSSRFSLDSVASDDLPTPGLNSGAAKNAKSTSLMSVKSIKKLWRRTNKASVSGSSSPNLPESGRSSPNSAPAAGKRSSRTMSRSPQPDQFMQPPQSAPGPAPLKPKRKTSLHTFQFNQESPYPIHPMPTRQPAVPPVPATTPPLPATTPPLPVSAPAAPLQGEKGARKSILKSFKSQSGSLSTHSSTSSLSVPRSSSEMPPPETRRRKGSVVELSSVMKRASGVSSSMTLVDIPRSPALPEHLVNSQSRSNSRQSQLSYTGSTSGRMSSASTRQRPSISSTDSSSSRAPSRLMAGASPPRNGSALGVPRTSGDSYESRPSFDESQFEIVSPKLAPSQALSYPYHGLDQSMSSTE
ncbi:hypothetical protein C8Q73DRAFT_377037 [Cubamyces lactineus]|nr:hypothetical protein C8Q73DRAFT_377037 [Cubamyces lactineus]